MRTVFEAKRSGGAVLREVFSDGAFAMQYITAAEARPLEMYSPAALGERQARRPYGGYSPEALLASGRDLLSEALLAEGEPSYARVEALLPQVEGGAYAFLGGAASWSGLEFDLTLGVLYSQVCENHNKPTAPLFDPRSQDAALGGERPAAFLLGGRLPALFAVHTDGQAVLEFLYFVEAGDPDRDPALWIRAKRYPLSDPAECTLSYRVVGRSRAIQDKPIPADTFYTALADTVAYWFRFEGLGATFSLPEKKLERLVLGAQIACAVTFSGDHPHYGHRYYGKEFHDHFPPNFLWSLEMCCVQGRLAWGRRILQHLFAYSLTDEGRFVYRQGDAELFGASACDYAQLLWLLHRYADALQVGAEYGDQLIRMGKYLLSHLRPCAALGGRSLIYMCAEADSNTRVHAYINNNLWCVRGLAALGALLVKLGLEGEEAELFRRHSRELYENVLAVLARDSIGDARFGRLPPFRLGYTAAPATLSRCRATFQPMGDEEYEKYARCINMREQGDAVQEYTENCYANYRYYPEMLGSLLLPEELAEGVLTLRENLGGELLGMTRFMGHLDDWPVLHCARYLLETGRTEKFLTLLYAHACHHGRPELGCYYEQVDIRGQVMAEDCIPSLLTVPIMTAWMFAFESTGEKRLSLLSGIPAAWYEAGFSARGVGLSFGQVDISASSERIKLRFSEAPGAPFRLVLRHRRGVSPENIAEGGAQILAFEGNVLVLSGEEREYTVAFR